MSQALNPTGPGTGNGANNSQPYNNESYNTFDKSNMRLYTQRFDEVKPNFCIHANDGDVVRIQTSHDLRTYTLKSPLLNGLQMKQEFFSVPFKAIMPHSWEYLERQPIVGDDVPAGMYPSVRLSDILSSLCSSLPSQVTSEFEFNYHSRICRVLLLLGPDSLLENLGINYDWYTVRMRNDIKALWEALYEFTESCSFIDPITKSLRFSSGSESQHRNAFYNWLNGVWDLYPKDVDDPDWAVLYDTYSDLILSSGVIDPFVQASFFDSPEIDLSPVMAYQMACYQFYSNSFVDQIFDGRQFYEIMESIALHAFTSTSTDPYAHINGKSVQYDCISKTAISKILYSLWDSYDGVMLVDFFCNLFAYQYSLRNDDYFTTARLRPLAIGGTDISVTSNKVNVVDVNKQLWVQRFLQAVNRSQQQIELYKENIEGVKPQILEPQPVKLYSISYDLNGQEINQTSASDATSDQGNVVTLMRSDESNMVPEVYCDSRCWIIGITKFYCPMPVYTGALHRQFMLHDRNDWFNPFLQHIGDQPVTTDELDTAFETPQVFGYQLRYSQWKTAVSLANGAFKYGGLPSWFVPAYSRQFYDSPILESYFLRNANVMIDSLYLSLTGNVREEYFHFILRFMHKTTVNSKQQAFPTLDV